MVVHFIKRIQKATIILAEVQHFNILPLLHNLFYSQTHVDAAATRRDQPFCNNLPIELERGTKRKRTEGEDASEHLPLFRHIDIRLPHCLGTDVSSASSCVCLRYHLYWSGVANSLIADTRRRHCKKNCLLDGSDPRARRQVIAGPPGLVRTGTTAAEEATPAADSLDVYRRMWCTHHGEECSDNVREISRLIRCTVRSLAD